MQGVSKRQVNAEEMLAELKRALESLEPASDVPPPSASTVSKSGSVGPESRRSQIDKQSGRPIKASAESAIGPPGVIWRSAKPRLQSWKLAAGGLALVGAAAIWTTLTLMNRAPNPSEGERSAVATEGPARSQSEQGLRPSSDSRPPMQDSRRQGGALEMPPDISSAPASSSSFPLVGETEIDAPHPGSFGAPRPASLGLETAPPIFTPAAPNPAPAPGPSQAVKANGAPKATAPSAPASTASALPPETPKPNATPAAHVSNEPAPPSTPKIESTKRPAATTALKKPARSVKVSAKPVDRVERQATLPARPKDAASPPQPAQNAGNPTPLAPAPAPAPTIQQRFADGVTHAFSYVTHLPGALVPHAADPNADAH
jgi:hypothetical protein